jgi:hypothetical protein
VCQPTPKAAAAEAIEEPSMLTMSASRLRALSVSTAREAICGVVSDHVSTSQLDSSQRQRRFHHANTVGRPATGRSRTNVRDRP